MDRTEANNRTEAQRRVDAAIKELEAAKAALALSEQEPACGRTVMKPSEVPVGEYFRYVNQFYGGGTRLRSSEAKYVAVDGSVMMVHPILGHDHERVYLTDPYGNAIEPCEKLPADFSPKMVMSALYRSDIDVWAAFFFGDTKDGVKYWEQFGHGKPLTPDAKAKLRGMIHKWNQENGGQG